MVSLAIPLLLSALLAASARGDETLVTVAQGALRGEITPDGLARAFRGIPYATPPTGGERPRIRPLASSPSPPPPLSLSLNRARAALRWAPPQPAQAWSGVYAATTDGAGCIQNCELSAATTCPPVQSEDCLFLNVFTPRLAAIDKPLPVRARVPCARPRVSRGRADVRGALAR
jgi:para-nitrobenzyl esterase